MKNTLEKTYNYWNNMYESVGLHVNMPIMGITEIMTQQIVLTSGKIFFAYNYILTLPDIS